jgi:N-acetylmuramoyl-L-alanine amidase
VELRYGVFLSLFLIIVLFLPSVSSAYDLVAVNNIRFWSYADYTRIVIDLSEEAEIIEKRLANPDRLYIDILFSRIHKEIKSDIAVENRMLKSVRAGQFDENTVRVVLDLEKIKYYKTFMLDEPSRIVVDVFGPTTFSAKKRIVIDAGHGGKDPGAIGPKRLYEKDVVLDIALKLRKLLSANKDIEVFLTREDDVFIPLEQRTAIANSKNADLFISIHANASPRRSLKGIETYFLNWTDEEEAMKVAARENAISMRQMKRIGRKMNVLDVMLNDLSRSYKRDESNKLAHALQRSVVSGLDRRYRHPIVDLGVKRGYFFVLLGADMPSVLVEVSFITNLLEARMLRKNSYREHLARSIASGIESYMSVIPDRQTVAETRTSIAP